MAETVFLQGPSPIMRSQRDYPETKHDESGQVYTEVSRCGGPMTADWKWRTNGSTREHKNFRSLGPGCSSFYNMSLRSCLLNSWDITAKTLEEVPETAGKALWDRIVTAQLDSVQVFLAFARRYPSMMGRKFHTISEPNLPLTFYLKEVTSPNYQWLTHLTLLHITLPRTALIQVSLVTNLAVLTVGPNVLAPDIGVDDSLIRTWSRAATTGAFCVLRVLALRGQSLVTPGAFDDLALFPALAVFATESVPGVGPRDKDTALARGWNYKSGEDLSDWLVMGGGVDSAKWDEISQAFFNLGGQLDRESLTAEDVKAVNVFPVLHLAVGGHTENAVIDVAGEGTMRVWYRLSKVGGLQGSNALQSMLPEWSNSHIRKGPRYFSTPSTHGSPQKRVLDSIKTDVVRKKVKPAMRSSKGQDIGDLLLGFGA